MPSPNAKKTKPWIVKRSFVRSEFFLVKARNAEEAERLFEELPEDKLVLLNARDDCEEVDVLPASKDDLALKPIPRLYPVVHVHNGLVEQVHWSDGSPLHEALVVDLDTDGSDPPRVCPSCDGGLQVVCERCGAHMRNRKGESACIECPPFSRGPWTPKPFEASQRIDIVSAEGHIVFSLPVNPDPDPAVQAVRLSNARLVSLSPLLYEIFDEFDQRGSFNHEKASQILAYFPTGTRPTTWPWCTTEDALAQPQAALPLLGAGSFPIGEFPARGQVPPWDLRVRNLHLVVGAIRMFCHLLMADERLDPQDVRDSLALARGERPHLALASASTT